MSGPETNPNAFEVTHGLVLNIAIPMTLGLITVPIVGMVDMAVIGQLGSAALMGGVAVGTLLFGFSATSFNFLRAGTTGLTAQALGAGDIISQRAVVYRALILALALGIIVMMLGPILVPPSLRLMGGSAAVNEAAAIYLQIRLFSMPFALANFAIFGWLFGLGRSRMGMLLLLLLNCSNILLTVWFVLSLEMGVAGAAWGTLTAEVLSMFAGSLALASSCQRRLAGSPAEIVQSGRLCPIHGPQSGHLSALNDHALRIRFVHLVICTTKR